MVMRSDSTLDLTLFTSAQHTFTHFLPQASQSSFPCRQSPTNCGSSLAAHVTQILKDYKRQSVKLSVNQHEKMSEKDEKVWLKKNWEKQQTTKTVNSFSPTDDAWTLGFPCAVLQYVSSDKQQFFKFLKNISASYLDWKIWFNK